MTSGQPADGPNGCAAPEQQETALDDAKDTDADEDHDDVLDALMCGAPPKTRATAWAQIDGISTGLREHGVLGHDALIRTLALLVSPSFRTQGFGPQFLLTALPSAGKLFLLGAVAETLGIPSLHVDASILTSEAWSGTNVSEPIEQRIGTSPGQFTLAHWRYGAVLVLDESTRRAAPMAMIVTARRFGSSAIATLPAEESAGTVSQGIFQRLQIQRLIRDQALELAILFLQRLEGFRLTRRQAVVLFFQQ